MQSTAKSSVAAPIIPLVPDLPPWYVRRPRTALVVEALVIVVAVLLIQAIGAWILTPTHSAPITIMITGVRWEFSHNGTLKGYFGANPDTVCAICPFTVSPRSWFSYVLELRNSDTSSHIVESVSTPWPFDAGQGGLSGPTRINPGEVADLVVYVLPGQVTGSQTLIGLVDTT